jgi:hypothetical protein
MKKIYISGKITGLDYEVAIKSFQDAEDKLNNEGYITVNPMKLNHEHDKSWESYMKEDLIALLDCTHIYMMKNWDDSRGAIIEHNLAKQLNIVSIYE